MDNQDLDIEQELVERSKWMVNEIFRKYLFILL